MGHILLDVTSLEMQSVIVFRDLKIDVYGKRQTASEFLILQLYYNIAFTLVLKYVKLKKLVLFRCNDLRKQINH
jgi:hypothetical protein